MAAGISIEEVRKTFACWDSQEPLAGTQVEVWKNQFEFEAKMLTLELLSEINESLKKLALLGDCVTEKNQLQTSAEVWRGE